MNLKIRLLALFFLILLPFRLFPVSYPITPSEPSDPGTTGSTEVKKKNAVPTDHFQATVELGSGDQISGKIPLPVEIDFSHYRNGLTYRKKIHPRELKSIRIVSFQYQKTKSEKSEDFYEFVPSETEITLRNGRNYRIRGIFRFLRQVNIDTIDGSTTIYSFFADSFTAGKGWREVESRDLNYHKLNGHPQVMMKIIFQQSEASGD